MYDDRVCLNCKHWQAMLTLKRLDDEKICRLKNGRTNPTDSCSQFAPKSTFDSLNDPNRFIDDRVLK